MYSPVKFHCVRKLLQLTATCVRNKLVGTENKQFGKLNTVKRPIKKFSSFLLKKWQHMRLVVHKRVQITWREVQMRGIVLVRHLQPMYKCVTNVALLFFRCLLNKLVWNAVYLNTIFWDGIDALNFHVEMLQLPFVSLFFVCGYYLSVAYLPFESIQIMASHVPRSFINNELPGYEARYQQAS